MPAPDYPRNGEFSAECLEKNLRLVEKYHDAGGRVLSYGKLETAPISRNITVKTARDGSSVPVLRIGERETALHSLFNPVREGERLTGIHGTEGFFVFFGLGFAYHIEPFLRSRLVEHALILEPDASHVKALFGLKDYSAVLSDPRVDFIIAPQDGELHACLLDSYVPLLSGKLSTVPLRPRLEAEKDFFLKAGDIIRTTVDEIRVDTSVQARFGKRWFKHTFTNLCSATGPDPTGDPTLTGGTETQQLFHDRKAIVTAAGPSLENALPDLRGLKGAVPIIATDTSFPALTAFGVQPDYVVSIDCQQISYRHFMNGQTSSPVFLHELASPPTVFRKGKKAVRIAGNHPLSRFVSRSIPLFLDLDTSGGNVTQTAIDFAMKHGAAEIQLFGADYAYPRGKPYARGTYFYPVFETESDRLAPLESSFMKFLFSRTNISCGTGSDGIIYRTAVLSQYRRNLEEFVSRRNYRLEELPGRSGAYLIRPVAEISTVQTRNAAFAPRTASDDPRSFIRTYAEILQRLPEPFLPLNEYRNSLSPEETSVFFSILPTVAYFALHDSEDTVDRCETLRNTISWCRNVLSELSQSS